MTLPYPPAAMRKATAAAYLSLSVAAFERLVASGRLPQPVSLDRHERWCTKALDKALLVLAGEVIDGEQVVVGERDAA